MTQPKWNPQTKKFEFPKEEKAANQVSDMAYVPVPRSIVKQLAEFAKQDGATVEATTARGLAGRETAVAKFYIEQAINDLIAARAKASK